MNDSRLAIRVKVGQQVSETIIVIVISGTHFSRFNKWWIRRYVCFIMDFSFAWRQSKKKTDTLRETVTFPKVHLLRSADSISIGEDVNYFDYILRLHCWITFSYQKNLPRESQIVSFIFVALNNTKNISVIVTKLTSCNAWVLAKRY